MDVVLPGPVRNVTLDIFVSLEQRQVPPTTLLRGPYAHVEVTVVTGDQRQNHVPRDVTRRLLVPQTSRIAACVTRVTIVPMQAPLNLMVLVLLVTIVRRGLYLPPSMKLRLDSTHRKVPRNRCPVKWGRTTQIEPKYVLY